MRTFVRDKSSVEGSSYCTGIECYIDVLSAWIVSTLFPVRDPTDFRYAAVDFAVKPHIDAVVNAHVSV